MSGFPLASRFFPTRQRHASTGPLSSTETTVTGRAQAGQPLKLPLSIALAGNLVNISMLLMYISNTFAYRSYILPLEFIQTTISTYRPSFPLAGLHIFLGAMGAILPGWAGAKLGARRTLAQPKEGRPMTITMPDQHSGID